MKKFGYSVMFCLGLFLSIVIFSEKNYADMVEDVGAVQIRQPSGEIFKARIQGDEWLHYAIVESSNEVLMRNSEGTWFYTLIDTSSNELITSENKYLIDEKPNNAVLKKDLDKVHVENLNNKTVNDLSRSYKEPVKVDGPNRTLIVMIEYNDFSLKNSKQDWYNKVFKKDTLSVNDYYNEATKGKITLTPVDNTQEDNVPGVIKVKLNKNHPNSGFDSDIGAKTREDIKLALDQLKNYVDFNQIDTDGSKFITPDELHTLFVFSGYSASAGANDPRITPTVWPHRSSGNYLQVSDKVMTTYTVVSDLRKSKLEEQDSMMTIGTVVHEFGHDFGLPDLYNPSGTKGAGLGSYSIMANSHTTMNGKISGTYPVHFDAYSKVKLGIITPTVVNKNQTININDIFTEDSNIVKIETDDPKQYYLLENRQFKGFDEALKTYIKNPGIGIYYVNENIQKNQGAGQQIVTLKEADEGIVGYSKLDAKVYNGYDGFYYKLGNHPTLLDGTTRPSTRLPDTDRSYLDYSINVVDAPKESMVVTFATPTIPVESISLDQSDLKLDIGEQKKLVVSVMPENATNKDIEWSSSDSSVVSVDENGKIEALGVGVEEEIEIIAKVKGTDKQKSVKVTVNPKGFFGTVEWKYDSSTSTLSFVSEGEFSSGETIPSDLISKYRLGWVSNIKFEQPVYLAENSSALFGRSGSYQIEGLDKVNTSKVKDMSYMFNTIRVEQLSGLETWDTSNVTTMEGMFMDTSIDHLNLSTWDTSNVINMDTMFLGSVTVDKLNLNKWDTSNVTSMDSMFGNTVSLKELNIARWNTSKVKNMNSMFQSSVNLKEVDVSDWDTSNVTGMNNMFNDCYSVTTLDVSDWNTSNVTTMYGMFDNCYSVTTLDVSDWNTSNVTNMSTMFYDSALLTTLEVSNWNTSNVTDMSYMFGELSNLKELNVSNWDTSNVKDVSDMFVGTTNLTTLTLGPKSIFYIEKYPIYMNPKSTGLSGRWSCTENGLFYDSGETFMKNYDGSSPGNYVRQD